MFKLKDASLIDEYIHRHQNVWEDVRNALKNSGIFNYSIWNYSDLLVAYYEFEDETIYEIAMTNLNENARYLQWRHFMEDIIAVDSEGAKEYNMQLVFNLD